MDVNDIIRDKTAKERKEMERYNRSLRQAGEGGGANDTLALNEEDQTSKIRDNKKQEAKKKREILTQFDKIA